MPVVAIKPDTEPALEKWLRLNAEYAKVWPNVAMKKPAPADSEGSEGKPDRRLQPAPVRDEGELSPGPGH
jgi:ferredoxin